MLKKSKFPIGCKKKMQCYTQQYDKLATGYYLDVIDCCIVLHDVGDQFKQNFLFYFGVMLEADPYY